MSDTENMGGGQMVRERMMNSNCSVLYVQGVCVMRQLMSSWICVSRAQGLGHE